MDYFMEKVNSGEYMILMDRERNSQNTVDRFLNLFYN